MLPSATLITDQIRQYCEQEGHKHSAKRLLVARQLTETGNFIDAESLWLKIAPTREISRATIYLALNWLFQNGFAEKKRCGTRMWVYRMKVFSKINY
jgi:Fe2+ or Zn2+ uptake regulation protein